MKLSSLLLLFGCLDQQSQAQENHHEDRYVSNDDKLIPEMNAIESTYLDLMISGAEKYRVE